MTRLEEQSKTREQNAAYLSGLLKEIPGIQVAKTHSGCTRNAYHLYMFRYNKDAFGGAACDFPEGDGCRGYSVFGRLQSFE